MIGDRWYITIVVYASAVLFVIGIALIIYASKQSEERKRGS